MKEISQKIGEKIKEAREEKNMTQKQLGEYLGYSTMGISYFEQGLREVKVSDLQKLSSFFGKDPSFFLSAGLTMFRSDKNSGADQETAKSLSDFDNFLARRKK
jgi:transcriptional regulator with XRE-family HTH domain